MQGALDHVTLHLVNSLDKAAQCARWASERREGPLFFDTESSGLNPYRDAHRLTQLGDLHHGWAFPPAWAGAAGEILTRYNGALGAHNSGYDWRVLRTHQGIELPWAGVHDSMTVCGLADSVRLVGLKPRAAIEIDDRALAAERTMKDGMEAQHWTWATVPVEWGPYWQYGALDPVLSAHLWAKLAPSVLGSYGPSYDLERATVRICAQMMDHGMMADEPFIRNNIAERQRWLDHAMAWLNQTYGLHSVESNDQVMRVLNAAGVPTLVWTESGQPSIAKDTLKMYAAEFPHAAALINVIATARKTTAVIGRYLEKFLTLTDSDGIIHYAIHPMRARTHRKSITDPPMQTYDRDEPVVRGCFRPRPGYVFITIDADQIEARLAAHFSRDRQMIADFHYADENHLKFFVVMASQIFSTQVTKTDPRYTHTKNATYGQIYGAGLEKAAATAGVPVAQMQVVYEGTQQRYPGLHAMMNRLIRDNKDKGHRPQTKTWGGRRLFADRGHEYALMNYQVQGTAAEVLKYGGVALDAAGFGPYMCMDAHDEFIIEAPREYAEDMLHEAERILTDRDTFAVPITWSGTILEDRWRKT